MNIGVDIKAFKDVSTKTSRTGISRYITCILDELQEIDKGNDYYLMECVPSDYTPVNPRWKKISHDGKMLGTLWLQTVVPKLMKKHGIDVFWAPEQIGPVFGVPRGVKVVTTIHDFTFLRYPQTCRTSVLWIQKLLTTPTIKKSAALVPVSDYIKKELLDLYPRINETRKIIRTVGNGVNERNVKIPDVKRENFLFFPGNMEPRKNLSKLIKALEIVKASGVEIDLQICGPSGWKNTDLRKLLESSPIKHQVKHLGYLSDADLSNRYLTCAAVVFPSVYEGFGLPVLEALNLNTPVLTSKGTVMEEIAGQNALYFDPYDERSIAETIIDFLKTGGPVINRKSLDKYTWRRSAEELLDVFREVAGQSS